MFSLKLKRIPLFLCLSRGNLRAIKIWNTTHLSETQNDSQEKVEAFLKQKVEDDGFKKMGFI
jgi:hypothetical protein